MDIDSSRGLVFIQKNGSYSNRVGTCWRCFIRKDPTLLVKDHICASILNQSVGRRRILVLASVDKSQESSSKNASGGVSDNSEKVLGNKGKIHQEEQRPSIPVGSGVSSIHEKTMEHKSLSYVESLGAHRIQLDVSFDKLKDLLQNYFLLDTNLISDVCSFSHGKIGNIVLLIRFWVAEGYLVRKDGRMTLTIAEKVPKKSKTTCWAFGLRFTRYEQA